MTNDDKKTIFVAATQLEVQPLLNHFSWVKRSDKYFIYNNYEIFIAGAGVFPMTYHLSRNLHLWDPKKIQMILVGIAGAYSYQLPLGTLHQVIEDIFADTGAEEKNGQILTMDQINLWSNTSLSKIEAVHTFPNNPIKLELPSVHSITVNTASGTESTIIKRMGQFKPDIENMEGAAFFQICKVNGISSTQIRTISNYVTPRNKSEWEIELAVKQLNKWIIQML
jgi:futalosine hydrolase